MQQQGTLGDGTVLELIRGTYGPDYLTADSIDIMFEKTTLLKVSDLQL